MKKKEHVMSIHNRFVMGMIVVAAVLGIVSGAQAATNYWDNNGSTAGFGTSASGTWATPTTGNSSQGWSTDESGGTVPGNVTTTTSDTLYFGTDSAGLGAGTITVSGTVSGRNIYFGSPSGFITLSGGTITMLGGGGVNAGTITVNNSSNSMTGTLSLGGGSGDTYHTQGSGSLALGTVSASGGDKALSVEGGQVTVGSGGISYNGRTFTKTGVGTLVLNGAGTSTSGTFSLLNGTVVINNKSSFGTGTLKIANGSITPVIQASQDFTGANAITTTSFVLDQSNANPTFSGNYSIEIAGTNSQRSSHTIYNNIVAGKSLIFNVINLCVTYGNQSLTFDGTGTTLGNGSIIDGTTGIGSLVKNGAGTLSLIGANTFSGGASVNSGCIAIGGYQALGTGVVKMNGGSLAGTLNGGTLSNTVNLATNATFDAGVSSNLTIAGAITNSFALTKIGRGTLTLSGTNTYRGGTTVSNGALIVSGSVTGAVTVVGGTLGGTGVVAGTVTNFATIGATDTSTIGMLTVSNLVMKPNSSYAWNYTTSGNTEVYVNGNLSLPTVVTVNVTKVSGQLPNQGVLFRAFSNSVSTDLSGWVITGTPTKTRAKVVENQVVLQTLQGTLVSFQ